MENIYGDCGQLTIYLDNYKNKEVTDQFDVGSSMSYFDMPLIPLLIEHVDREIRRNPFRYIYHKSKKGINKEE